MLNNNKIATQDMEGKKKGMKKINSDWGHYTEVLK